MGLALGCYTYQPIANQPLPLGTTVELSINDAGRAILGGSMGPEIASIEGRLIRQDSAEYVVAVSQLQLLRNGTQVWNGERVVVRKDFVTGIRERQLSKSRTAVLSAVVVGAVATALSQGLNGMIAGDQGKPAPTDTGRAIRIPRFAR